MEDRINYYRIEEALNYLSAHYKEQPSLEKIAAQVHLSSFHFQRLFSEWAGVSPKKYMQFLSIEYAKSVLKYNDTTLLDATIETGLSSTSRLHDLFINIEGMTPGEFKNGGASLLINYSYAETQFGDILLASTFKGICHLCFADDQQVALAELKQRLPHATYILNRDNIQQQALGIFKQDWSKLNEVKLHLKATPFQLKVWQALLNIPSGRLSTYQDIAKQINNPKASRAVGTAIGENPVAFLIPCHRVIRSSGVLGHYHWGSRRKTAIIGWEAARSVHSTTQ